MSDKTHLPYQMGNFALSKEKELEIVRYLRKKFFPQLKKQQPFHPLINQQHSRVITFIKAHKKKHPFFLKFDIKKYYVNINHQILIKVLKTNYQHLTNTTTPKPFLKLLKTELPLFLKQSLFENQGIALGSALSYLLGYLYLLNLDLKITTPFLRYADDYLVFFKSKKDLDLFVKQTLMPELSYLKLEVQVDKLVSGTFAKNKVCYLGFCYKQGHFVIEKQKIIAFETKIKKLTSLRNKKPNIIVLRKINQLVNGFGHYYKYGSVMSEFTRLDKMIRMRYRRYCLKHCTLSPNRANLNNNVDLHYCRSLVDIYQGRQSKGAPKLLKSPHVATGFQHGVGRVSCL
jgi:hypothetical protein